VTSQWARSALKPTGASLRAYTDPAAAYAALERGQVAAVADTERGAWAGIEHRPDLAVARTADAGAHDVIVAAGPGTVLLGALDGAVAGLLDSGRYALLWTKWFPGSTVPPEVGQ
jgi:ABC-type amino acid transport substrate-binding protein